MLNKFFEKYVMGPPEEKEEDMDIGQDHDDRIDHNYNTDLDNETVAPEQIVPDGPPQTAESIPTIPSILSSQQQYNHPHYPSRISVASTTHTLPTIPRQNTRTESMLRFAIRKMRGSERTPVGITTNSLTDLICEDYQYWPRDVVLTKVDEALKRLAQKGTFQVTRRGQKETYKIDHRKMKKCLFKLKRSSLKERKLIRELSNDLSSTIKVHRKRN